MRALVTGGSGFIGRWAVEGLSRLGVEVVSVSRGPSTSATQAKTIIADLLNPGMTRQLVHDIRPDALLHLAWVVTPMLFWTAPENADWITATLNLARCAAEAGATRIVGTGTCFEYAWPDDGVCEERRTPAAPTTAYAAAKDTVRGELKRLSSELKLSFAWARIFFLYGPFEHPTRLVPSVALNLARGQPAPLSSGTQIRDFMDVRDAGHALAALTVSQVEGDVNIGSGRPVTLAEIAGYLGRVAGHPELIAYGALPDRPGEPRRIVAATDRLRFEVGAPEPRQLEQGLAEAYEWWKSRANT